jgi:hypothetical protein
MSHGFRQEHANQWMLTRPCLLHRRDRRRGLRGRPRHPGTKLPPRPRPPNGVRTRAACKAARPVPQLTTTVLKPSRARPRTALQRDKAKGTPKAKELQRAKRQTGIMVSPTLAGQAGRNSRSAAASASQREQGGTTRIRHPANPQDSGCELSVTVTRNHNASFIAGRRVGRGGSRSCLGRELKLCFSSLRV